MQTIREMSLVEKLRALLPLRQRVKCLLLISLTLVTAIIETTGIASVAPFLAMLAAPEMVETNKYLGAAYNFLGVDREEFLLVLGLLSFIGLVGATACRALNMWAQTRFNRSIEYGLAQRLMTNYLHRPYTFFLGRNNADLTKMVLSEAGQAVSDFLSPIITLISNAITATLLLALLCAVNAQFTFATALVFGGIYALIFVTTRQWLARLGERRYNANRQRFEAASEVFGGIKEIKLLGSEHVYLKRFSNAYARLTHAQANANLAGTLPGYALELIAFGGGLLAALHFLQSPEQLAQVLPLIALYILCARRILPSIQRIFKSVTTLRYSQPAVNRLLEDFAQGRNVGGEMAQTTKPLFVADAIRLENVSFTYPVAAKAAVSNLSLVIPVGARVGFVGATGSGKTTTVDLVLGLLSPTTGRILIDGTPLGPHNLRCWQRNLGYVPQYIYLADDLVAANIAFGLPPREMDREAVERAALNAAIHDFVANEMPQGYDTLVGERGVRLSGGQRQRIGIARALYRDPKIIVFDEATSALDNRTEKTVMQGLQSLGRDRTLIFVAHRLSTVRDCDIIYVFARGGVQAQGTYDELTATSAEFKSLAAYGS